jgi:hypothetical protein
MTAIEPATEPGGSTARGPIENVLGDLHGRHLARTAARDGCQPVYSPERATRALFERSGHCATP